MSLQSHSINALQLPFFCSSNSLLFYLDDSTSFSQILTIYNPYEFPVKYKVLCTAPRKYLIAEPQGEIRGQHSVDSVVRLLDISSSSSNQNIVHKIRIQFYDRRKPQDLIGKRDVTCTILSYKPLEENFDDDNAASSSGRLRPPSSSSSSSQSLAPANPANVLTQDIRDPFVVFLMTIAGLLSAFVLILPSLPEENTNTRIPHYLHMSVNSKVIASYVLEKRLVDIVSCEIKKTMKTFWKSFELTQYLKIAFEYNEQNGSLNIFLKNDQIDDEQQSSSKSINLISNNIYNWELQSNLKCKHHDRNDTIILDNILTDNIDDCVIEQHVNKSSIPDSQLITKISSIKQCDDDVIQQSDNYIHQQKNLSYIQQEQECEILYMQLTSLFVYDDDLKQEQQKLYPYEMNFLSDTDDYDLSNSSLTPSDDGYASVEEKIHEHHCIEKKTEKQLVLYERETVIKTILYQKLDKFFYIRRFVSNLLQLKPFQHTVLTMMS
ncbi:unnamed protein product [Didymodactylos carnosus]|uniref:MSP domain-containing protein n=1 Tax=Didymodactylos carnosus TaxID=1234261 RepID=A0A8S2I130_9BILA|nr:unnamed protein product [Didymodactylos carnosus]CAF3700781.1 unnamed protein product [Didymodactylos carnosus]